MAKSVREHQMLELKLQYLFLSNQVLVWTLNEEYAVELLDVEPPLFLRRELLWLLLETASLAWLDLLLVLYHILSSLLILCLHLRIIA